MTDEPLYSYDENGGDVNVGQAFWSVLRLLWKTGAKPSETQVYLDHGDQCEPVRLDMTAEGFLKKLAEKRLAETLYLGEKGDPVVAIGEKDRNVYLMVDVFRNLDDAEDE